MALNELSELEVRFSERLDELKWLYYELYYGDEQGFQYLCSLIQDFYENRSESLKALDRKREKDPDWYRGNDIVGMMLYVDNFADNLKGVIKKLDYFTESGVNYVHLMPLLESPKEHSDGGYAVSDFRSVQPELGTMDDLRELTELCHKRDISCCLDFVMNHTSDEHEWAKAARAGDENARGRYFFFDNRDIPNEYEKTVPQVFPTTAPGNFTQLPDGKIVMTTFYPYQWDLDYSNPMVFNDMTANMLYLANAGIDVIRLDAVPYIWKELGTQCRNLPQVHSIVRMMRIICEIVCPSVLLLGEVVMEPSKIAPYFGTVEKPECNMLYNVTTMASTWNSVGTRDIRLLERQMNELAKLPKNYVFLNYLRCHDDIGWGLDYDWLKSQGMEQAPHKKYLNDYFIGKFEGSVSRGELAACHAASYTTTIRFCRTPVSAVLPRVSAVLKRLSGTRTRKRSTLRSKPTSCSTPLCSPRAVFPSSTAATRSDSSTTICIMPTSTRNSTAAICTAANLTGNAPRSAKIPTAIRAGFSTP